MPIEVKKTLESGGASMVALLTFCIYSRKLDPVFWFLVSNYRLQPTASKAQVLYSEFLAPQSSLDISVGTVALAKEWHLKSIIDRINQADHSVTGQADAPGDDQDETADITRVVYLPERSLFNGVLDAMLSNSEQFTDIEQNFDPQLSAVENLPGGALTPFQRQFNEQVWKPSRLKLSVAGYFMIANIGG